MNASKDANRNARQLLVAMLAGLLIAAVGAVAVQPVMASGGPTDHPAVLAADQVEPGPAADLT